jgi:hypothetical protein
MTPTRLSLNCNFAAANFLDPLFTFTRPGTATRINPQTGLVETVAAGVPRLEKEGLLIEGAATNLISVPICDWGQAYEWGFGLGEKVTGPDGNLSAVRITAGWGRAHGWIGHYEGGEFCASFWARAVTGNPAVNFIITPGQSNPIALDQTWRRFSQVRTYVDYWLIDEISGGHDIEIACAQLESGSVATSYIPTPTSGEPAARAADKCFIEAPGGDVPWWNPANFTIVADAVWSSLDGGFAFDFPLASGVPGVGWGINSNSGQKAVSSGAAIWGVECESSRMKIAITQNSSGSFYSLNGGSVIRFGDANVTDKIGRLSIGLHRFEIFPLNGHIRSLQIVPHQVSDGLLAALSVQ